jgi:parallel beta-helix repeat protein
MSEGSHLRWRVLRVRRGLPSITVSLLLITALFVGLDLSFDIIPNVSSGLIEVDDSGGKDYLTIQEGVDAAIPGDTVFVYAGVYNEDVVIDKTINLTGENKANTIINTTNTAILAENADYINISGFTIENGSSAGIILRNSNYSRIENNIIQKSIYGLILINANSGYILNNDYYNIIDYTAIYLDSSSENLIENNTVKESNMAIWLTTNSNNNTIENNNCSNNEYGLSLTTGSKGNIIRNNVINFNNGIFNYHTGISLGTSSNDNIFINNTIIGNKYGILVNSVTGNIFINSTIIQSEVFDIHIKGSVVLTMRNCSFNKSSVEFTKTTSMLIVQWYLHIHVIDSLNNPVPNVKVQIEDNKNGSYNETFITDGNGDLVWLPIIEYVEQDFNDDSIGERIYYTPHRIIAWNDTLVGYAYPEPTINKSKTVTIVLYNGTLMDLEPGWNLISLPRIQSDTNLPTILQSIKGRYDSVQWYNISDINDTWKHYNIMKPSYMNDLEKINHTNGFWIHIIDPDGTILVVFGDILTFGQQIALFPGWNLVGYPSKFNKSRDVALGNLFYGPDVDSIWTYNSTMQKWKELDNSTEYFEVGMGYWIHSKVEDVWNVPL